MGYHIIGCLDIIFMVFEIVQAMEYRSASSDEMMAIMSPILSQYYSYIFDLFAATAAIYSAPRLIMYISTLIKPNSYRFLKWYFRTRIVTLIALFLTHISIFILIFLISEELSKAFDSTRTFLLLLVGGTMFIWLAVDLYWSVGIRTYKDTKAGKRGRDAALKL